MSDDPSAPDVPIASHASFPGRVEFRRSGPSSDTPLVPDMLPAMETLSAPDIVPALLPARMINEFSYCPRLAYLEWVQGEFAASADTLDGSRVHRRVDQPTGDLAEAGEDDKEDEQDTPRGKTAKKRARRTTSPHAISCALRDIVRAFGSD